VLALLAGGSPVAACRAAPDAPPPNVVLIVIDTLRADRLPFHGYGSDTAPFLSELAAGGAMFENAQSTSAWTGPAVASLFTGTYPFQHNVVVNFHETRKLQRRGVAIDLNRLPDELETIPESMKRAGYATFGIVSNWNLGEPMGFTEGFDAYAHFSRSETATEVNVKLMEWEDRIKRSGKYFLYLHYFDPHAPYVNREPGAPRKAETAEERRAAYDSEIRFVDGRIRQAYERFGWARGTALVVTADHGEELQDRGRFGHSTTLFSELLHVPLVVQLPDRPAARRRVAETVSHVDVVPTLRELAGLPPDPRNSGRSLLPLIRQRADEGGERCVFAHLVRRSGGERLVLRAAIRGGWKYVETTAGHRLLFDMKADPRETANRIAEAPALARELADALHEYEKAAPRYASTERTILLDPRDQEELKTLGYLH
jgi:arylsulfatase A-like enzyme